MLNRKGGNTDWLCGIHIYMVEKVMELRLFFFFFDFFRGA